MSRLFLFAAALISVSAAIACSKDKTVTPEPGGEDPLGVIEYNNQWYKAGDTVYGYKNYVFLVVGDKQAPLMLGVPHDGIATGSPAIPETGDTGRDLNTNPFATEIARLFTAETGLKPWVMVNLITRKRVDPNTYPDELAGRYKSEDARKTWESYHELLSAGRAVMAASLKEKGGLFIDIHGHAHRYANDHQEPYTSTTSGNQVMSNFIDQTEVGYGLSNYALEQADSYIDGLANSASVGAVATAHPDVKFSALIRGQYSFGGLLQAQSVNAVPGDHLPKLDRNASLFGTEASGKPARRPYFNGGYVTRKYGTVVKGKTIGYADNISSLQTETPGITVRNNASIIAVSAARFKKAIVNYLNHWYGYQFINLK